VVAEEIGFDRFQALNLVAAFMTFGLYRTATRLTQELDANARDMMIKESSDPRRGLAIQARFAGAVGFGAGNVVARQILESPDSTS